MQVFKKRRPPVLPAALCAGVGLWAMLPACGKDGATGPDASSDSTVSYAEDVAPIFSAKCNYCHRPGSPVALYFTDPFDPEYGAILYENTWRSHGSPEEYVIDPGNPENSFLIRKVADPNLDVSVDGNPMPYQIPRLTAEELSAVKQWIADGAKDDAFFADNVAPIFGTELSLTRTGGKCTLCHFPGSPTGMSVLDVFDPDEGMVNADSIYGGKIVAPGDVENSVLIDKLESATPPGAPMPLHPARLTDSEVEILRQWILDGAPNN